MIVLHIRPQTRSGEIHEARQRYTKLTEPEGDSLCSWRLRKNSDLPLENKIEGMTN